MRNVHPRISTSAALIGISVWVVQIKVSHFLGHEVWRGSYNSPVMAVFALEEGQLRKVPFHSVAVDGIDSIGLAALSMYAKTDELKTAETNVR